MEKMSINAEDFRKLVRDVAQIKEILRDKSEIELTDWARKELEKSRKDKTISHSELEKELGYDI